MHLDMFDVMLIVLLVMLVYSFTLFPVYDIVLTFLVMLGITLAESLFFWFKTKKFIINKKTLITLLIVYGITGVEHHHLSHLVASIIAVLSKHVIRNKRLPVFNPAAFGVFITSLFIPITELWWAETTLALIGIIAAYRAKRITAPLAFIALSLLTTQTPNLFFALFMLSEPFTTLPGVKKGFVLGIIAFMLSFIGQLLFVPSSLIFALLTVNASRFWISKYIN